MANISDKEILTDIENSPQMRNFLCTEFIDYMIKPISQVMEEEREKENILNNEIPAKPFYELSYDLNNDPNTLSTDCVKAFEDFAKREDYNPDTLVEDFE